ncbi:biotin carboxylase [Leucobacter sp. OLJS4]|uniref:ATP-grasp domain-containing protein n=2 Tax=Leucobacter TaxID=55968 RepID=UPI000C18E94A|nr:MULTISPECIES: ATP-grasp domain-containing protein [unclassified Leucobacter]PII84465.1 biotin carboxylase [Leucobacter sp. OLCALW19]PII88702.1 biotin carboxylase [Leucobacter sp. OLTLW20]PII90940.1 biotin carboxylase [Leucobacter sp. OLAS13]PIJ05441.1 biotin carboxylase [Leucobacter sp. OLIS6]PIJ13885.1 biotin carboxylase [Leucobacter sp. OLJS4]
MTARVLVTGAGGPAGVAVIRSLLRRDDVTVFAADMDGWASGLYLVPAEQRRLVPPGRDPEFVAALATLVEADRLDLVISTVDVELLALAERREELAPAVLAAPPAETLRVALDKLALADRCAATGRSPRTVLAGPDALAVDWEFPVFAKPRQGAGSRGIRLVADRAALETLPTDEGLIVQDLLPGEEYSVDVIADANGGIVAAVPRTRARVDSGVAIAGRTMRDPELEETAAAVARAIGLVGVANVQLRRDRAGRAMLLEVNPRFPGALPLTIAAGVDIPSLMVDLFLGETLPERVGFREVASVRFLEDVIVEVDEVLESAHAGHQDDA